MRGTLPLMGETTFHSNNLDVYVLGGGGSSSTPQALFAEMLLLFDIRTVQCGNRHKSLSDGGNAQQQGP